MGVRVGKYRMCYSGRDSKILQRIVVRGIVLEFSENGDYTLGGDSKYV